MVLDGESGRLLVIGGETSAGITNEFWAFNLASRMWESLETPDGLPPLADFSLVLGGESMYLVGGKTTGGELSPVVYRFDGGGVEKVADLAEGPGERSEPAVACYGSGDCDPGADKLLLYGGTDPSGAPHCDLWELDTGSGD